MKLKFKNARYQIAFATYFVACFNIISLLLNTKKKKRNKAAILYCSCLHCKLISVITISKILKYYGMNNIE